MPWYHKAWLNNCSLVRVLCLSPFSTKIPNTAKMDYNSFIISEKKRFGFVSKYFPKVPAFAFIVYLYNCFLWHFQFCTGFWQSHENLGTSSDCSDGWVFSFYVMNSKVICNIDTILVFYYAMVLWSLLWMIGSSLLENVIKFSVQFQNP